jgi:1-deoxy-D-xylulose-5-phosphate synthase
MVLTFPLFNPVLILSEECVFRKPVCCFRIHCLSAIRLFYSSVLNLTWILSLKEEDILPGILANINSPADLKGLSYPEMEILAAELREEIIKTISTNGGHLASSLGAVELTLALHRIFNSPEDKIIWDVGHQAYAHKLLTGRRERFSTIRQLGGLSPFPSRQESMYDAFTTGHAGTSVSAALGMAMARDLKKDKYEVVAVIGDGSLSAGMAFEAINHTGHQNSKIIVILNDNGMTISPTLGAMARLLNQVRTDSRYKSAKNRFVRLLSRISLGRSALKLGKFATRNLERVILPSAFWEQMGFVYLGPSDGHNIRDIETTLTRARDSENRPVVVHVMTTKGKGYAAAESNAVKFHGIAPNTAVKTNGIISYSQVFGKTVLRLMRENERVVAISAAMLDGTGLTQAAAEFPDRVIDVGICEQHAVTLAAGLATQGLIPIVAIYSTFLQRSYDQIVHDVCLPNLPVVFAVDRAGIVGEDGATHQGALDISFLRSVPNMIVSAAGDEDELQNLIYTAVKAGRPMAVRYPRGEGEGITPAANLKLLEIGKSVMVREGSDVAVLAIGTMLHPAMKAAGLLAQENVDCAVINVRFAKPLDKDLIIQLARNCGRLVTIEENSLNGGFGSAVLDCLAEAGLTNVKVERLGLPDRFIEHGDPDYFRSKYDLDTEGIVRRVKAAFNELFLRKPLLRKE